MAISFQPVLNIFNEDQMTATVIGESPIVTEHTHTYRDRYGYSEGWSQEVHFTVAWPDGRTDELWTLPPELAALPRIQARTENRRFPYQSRHRLLPVGSI